MSKLYSSILTAKNGLNIPVFCSGKPVHSKYDPLREAETFGADVSTSCSFFIILGLGGGYHIASLVKRFPDAEFFIIENSADDISFVRVIPCVLELMHNPHIHVFTADSFRGSLKPLYIPALYGSLQILCHRAWAEENKETAESIKSAISQELSEIKADYSVQSHFGAIWQRNIIYNLKQAASITAHQYAVPRIRSDLTAAVIAAGPTLDYSIQELSQNRKKFYIIAADTAYGALVKHGIIPDAAVSLDGQMISHCHFMNIPDSRTLFVFDLCANPAAVRRTVCSGASVFFVHSGHPLCVYADGNFPQLEAGAGTVTIAAADFARRAGFRSIRFFGADFSYPGGKPYARGTYLDTLYAESSIRTITLEQTFDRLMYRTPLVPLQGKPGIYTTSVLDSYRMTLETWKLENQQKTGSILNRIPRFDFESFSRKLHEDAENQRCIAALLPYIYYLRMQDSKFMTQHTFPALLKLAYSNAIRYTDLL